MTIRAETEIVAVHWFDFMRDLRELEGMIFGMQKAFCPVIVPADK